MEQPESAAAKTARYLNCVNTCLALAKGANEDGRVLLIGFAEQWAQLAAQLERDQASAGIQH
jgi:hypothetical protein